MLFHIQDTDCPMYVIAKDWQEALEKWRSQLCDDADELTSDSREEQPQGIALIAEDDELIL